jgi:hypothetical protein
MRPSQDYYRNRRKLKRLTHDSIEYRPTVGDVTKWFNILNEQIFGSKLAPITKIRLIRHKGYHAFYYYYPRKDPNFGHTRMSFTKRFKSKKMFVEILAHEMIHHFQHLHNEPIGHGPSFTAWGDNFKTRGLKLYRVR